MDKAGERYVYGWAGPLRMLLRTKEEREFLRLRVPKEQWDFLHRHEAMHRLMRKRLRRRWWQRRWWQRRITTAEYNEACDYVINQILGGKDNG